MKTQTSIAARNCRLQEWAQMIQECNNRPVGVSVSEWCQAHSITTANYYYRMTHVRKIEAYKCKHGIAVAKSLTVKIPDNIIFVSIKELENFKDNLENN